MLVCLWVASNWPRKFPDISDIRMEEAAFIEPIPNHKPTLSIRFFNDNIGTLQYHEVSACAIYPGISDMKTLEQDEREVWKKVVDTTEDDRKRAKNEDDFYWLQLPPKVRSTGSVECSVLPTELEQNLQNKAGVTVIVVNKYVYYDSPVGERGLESCVLTQGKELPVHCTIGHNGPAKINRLYWWNAFF